MSADIAVEFAQHEVGYSRDKLEEITAEESHEPKTEHI
jgi:hypothetical protein